MENEALFQRLLALNPYERIAKQFYQRYGYEMDYTQLYYLTKYPNLSDPIEALMTETARSEQQTFRKHLRSIYLEHGLTAQYFISQNRNMEIEQLQRYIQIPKHKHDFIELVFVLSGTCTHTIDSHVSIHQSGDLTIIPPDIEHYLYASEDCVCLTVKLRSDTFMRQFSDIIMENSVLSAYFSQVLSLPYYRCALTLHSGYNLFFRDLLLYMYAQQDERKAYSDSIIQSLLLALLTELVQNHQDTMELMVFDSVQHLRMIEILNYIFENYQNITLKETAHHFYMSASNLSTKIHQQTGSTFSALLRSYKLQRAAELLLSTDKNLNLICDEIGYSDTTQFIRSFKEIYHVTPARFRKRK